MTDARETVQAVGEILTGFLKTGPTSPDHLLEIRTTISELTRSIAISVDETTTGYERVCREFLDKVIRVKGMPTRIISGDPDSQPDIVSSSGKHVAQNFDALLPSIKKRFEWCITNYKSEATAYLDEQLCQCDALVQQFLERVPMGGTKDKDTKSRISEVKKELRPLAKWDRRFYIFKAMSFPAEIEYLFALEGNPIAAIWHYNQQEAQHEFRKIYSHEQRDDHVYAVRGNWAIEKGLMSVRPNDGYIDDIARPRQEMGCMCHLQWLHGINRIPSDMLTEKGRSERVRAKNAVDLLMMERAMGNATRAESDEQKPDMPVESETRRSAFRDKLLRWFGRG